MRTFNHVGMVLSEKIEGMIYVEPLKVHITDILEVAQAEVVHPEILLKKWGERYAVVLEHIEKSLLGYIFVELAVGVVVGVGVLFGVGLLCHNFSVLGISKLMLFFHICNRTRGKKLLVRLKNYDRHNVKTNNFLTL